MERLSATLVYYPSLAFLVRYGSLETTWETVPSRMYTSYEVEMLVLTARAHVIRWTIVRKVLVLRHLLLHCVW